MSLVLQNSQNQQIIEACLAIMKSMFSPQMQNSKKRLTKDYLANKVGFQGLFDSDSFTVRLLLPQLEYSSLILCVTETGIQNGRSHKDCMPSTGHDHPAGVT